MSGTPFYITTPIYYVNATPHLGTFYSTVVADALARFHRIQGDDTMFLTGLDEHGQKIERIARDRGVPLQAYCDGIAAQFQATWKRAGISHDAFVRTSGWATATDGTKIAEHAPAVHEMWRRMEAAGDVYQAEYDGLYCVGCEDWKSDDDVVIEGGEKVCPIDHRPVERVKEQNYFFRLSKYAQPLLELYGAHKERSERFAARLGGTPFVRPESRLNEVASFVRGGLRDLSISRMKKSVSWGIPVAGDPEHTVYVWIDALTNYLTALGGPGAVASGEGRAASLWRHAHHLIAKDILRFHAVYWPAILMSAGLPLPSDVFCHGYLTLRGQKISKSLPATKVDPLAIADDLDQVVGTPVGVELIRYFLLREYTLGGDGDFSTQALLQRYESDLGNDLGNLLNRTSSMVHRYLGATLAAETPQDNPAASLLIEETRRAWESFRPANALEVTWRLVRSYNVKIDQEKPWTLAKDAAQGERLREVLGACCEALRWIALAIAPAMPAVSREILRQLGRSQDEGTWPGEWGWPGGVLAEPRPLFPRLEEAAKTALVTRWMPADEGASSVAAGDTAVVPGIDAGPLEKAEFDRVELRAARVLACERVPKTEKLLKLTLDIGTEQRTVVSGIAGAYAPEALVGRTVVYLANLKPAKIRGVVSQGMILAAGDAEVLALIALDRDVPPGTRIR